mgnify:CR=1 FL=1
MRTRLRRFLLIFMMLALPVQAFASVVLLGCEFAHDDAAMQTAIDMSSASHAMHGSHEAPREQPVPSVGEHQCSHCTACYLAAAFPIPATCRSPRLSAALFPKGLNGRHEPPASENTP